MHVVEHQSYRVVSDWMHLEHHHVFLAWHRLALIGRMPLHLRARALHPQIFGRQLVALAVVETDDEGGAIAAQLDLGRPDLARTCPGRTRRRICGHARAPWRPGRDAGENMSLFRSFSKPINSPFCPPPPI